MLHLVQCCGSKNNSIYKFIENTPNPRQLIAFNQVDLAIIKITNDKAYNEHDVDK